MLESIPYAKLLEWQMFDQISPIGDRRGDWQAAAVCAAVMNAMTIGLGVPARFAPRDFLLDFSGVAKEKKDTPAPAPPVSNWQRMRSIARMFSKQANAADEDRKNRIRHGRRR